jgi:hypothetical protein
MFASVHITPSHTSRAYRKLKRFWSCATASEVIQCFQLHQPLKRQSPKNYGVYPLKSGVRMSAVETSSKSAVTSPDASQSVISQHDFVE